ncbi:hypothetical protein CRUP_010112 [Coryphaenoides rupestris]|nr:hypothetical protein CRUP_010112 [Coryphaenoides rupestris]
MEAICSSRLCVDAIGRLGLSLSRFVMSVLLLGSNVCIVTQQLQIGLQPQGRLEELLLSSLDGRLRLQAVMASDFALPRFQYLQKLLLVHGHWCYSRLANMILYFFYKNAMFVALIFWFQFYCGFSGSSMVDQWYLVFFNLMFSAFPQLEYKPYMFWMNMLDAFYQSLVCFFIPYFAYADSDVDLFTWGTPITTLALITILLHLGIETKTWTWMNWASILFSVCLFFAVALSYNASPCPACYAPSSPYWTMQRLLLDATHGAPPPAPPPPAAPPPPGEQQQRGGGDASRERSVTPRSSLAMSVAGIDGSRSSEVLPEAGRPEVSETAPMPRTVLFGWSLGLFGWSFLGGEYRERGLARGEKAALRPRGSEVAAAAAAAAIRPRLRRLAWAWRERWSSCRPTWVGLGHRATGIEDRLQDGVPETIASLRKAGLQIWVLTGDKQETAINIAYACKLLDPEEEILTLNADSQESCAVLLEESLLYIQSKFLCSSSSSSPPPHHHPSKDPFHHHHHHHAGDLSAFHLYPPPSSAAFSASSASPHAAAPFLVHRLGLVIDGRTLAYALDKSLEDKFLAVARSCRSVLCCRSTPLQKSMVVQLVRNKLKVMTLGHRKIRHLSGVIKRVSPRDRD